MSYCTKCGNELKDGDLFCSKCGAKVELIEVKEDIFSDNYNTNRVSYTTHKCSKIGLILAIIGLVFFVIFVAVVAKYYHYYELPKNVVSVLALLMLATFVLGGASLGLSIPGFIISKKRKIKSGVAITALILSIILGAIILILYGYVLLNS